MNNPLSMSIRRFCRWWLVVFCVLTLPLGGVFFAVPVLLAYYATRRIEHCPAQVAVGVGGISLLYMVLPLVDVFLWKLAGNHDAQEPIALMFIFLRQTGISIAAMLAAWLLCAGARNLRRPYP